MEIDDLICDLLDQPVVQKDNSIVFNSNTVELIHEIAGRYNGIYFDQAMYEQSEEYAKNLSAEEVYYDMLVKIVTAPTQIHMKMSARLLIPIISQKLKEREAVDGESNII